MRALPPTSLSSTTLASFQPVFVDESHPLKLNKYATTTTPRLRAGRREGVTPGTCARLPKGMNSEDGSPSAVDHHAAVSRDRGFENTTYILLFAKPSTFAGGCSIIDGADRVRKSRIRQVEPMGFQHELNAIARHGTSASRPTLECNVDCATVLSDGRRRRPKINWQKRWTVIDTLPTIIIRECNGECPRSVDLYYRCRRCRRRSRRPVVSASAGSKC